MDLAYLRAHPDHIPTFIKHQRIRVTPVHGHAQRLTLDDGTDVFAKLCEGAPADFTDAEARGLAWLREAVDCVPAVLTRTGDLLVTEWIDPGRPAADAAERLGRDLAELHRSGAARFGAPWPGYIGAAGMDNDCDEDTWPEWFARRRLVPYLRASRDNGALSAADASVLDSVLARLPELAGEPEPVARLHGDLWPGNVHWGADGRGWLIDPAAHGGHRETDLASLRLWGGPAHLDRIVAGYEQVWPLADGWTDRVELHQLFLLLAHTATFGRQFRDQVMHAARRYA